MRGILYYLMAVIAFSCADYDVIDDINDFTVADVNVVAVSDFGSGTDVDPFLIDIGKSVSIDIMDLRDPESNRILNDLVNWSSSDESVATIQDGMVNALSDGTTLIRATKFDEVSAREFEIGIWHITVFEFQRLELRAEGGRFAQLQGRNLHLYADFYTDANELDSSVQVTWVSSDPLIATINELGLVSALDSGFCQITASIEVAGGFVESTVEFEVLTNSVDVFRVEILNTPSSLVLLDTIYFEAVAYDIDGDIMPDKEFTWFSSNESVLDITSPNIGIGRSIGTTSITVQSDEVLSESINISVISGSEERQGTIVSGRGGTTGTVTLFRDPDDKLLKVRLNEDFFGANIPGPVLILSNSEVSVTGGLKIQEIEPGDGNNRVFEVPGNPGIYDFDYLIYHCEPFNVIYGSFLLE